MSEEETADAAKTDPAKTIDHQPATDLKRRAETESKVEGSLS